MSTKFPPNPKGRYATWVSEKYNDNVLLQDTTQDTTKPSNHPTWTQEYSDEKPAWYVLGVLQGLVSDSEYIVEGWQRLPLSCYTPNQEEK